MFYYFNKFSILLFQLVLINFTCYCSYHFYDKASDSQVNTDRSRAGISYIVCVICAPARWIGHPFLCSRIEAVPKRASEGPWSTSVESQSPGPGGQDHVRRQPGAGAQTPKEVVAFHFQRPDGTGEQPSPAIPSGGCWALCIGLRTFLSPCQVH